MLEQAIMVPVQAAAETAVDHTVRNALIACGGILLVGAAAATVAYIATRDKTPELTALTKMAAANVCNDIAEVQKLREAAVAKAVAPAMQKAREEYPNEFLDNPMASLVALNVLNNKG